MSSNAETKGSSAPNSAKQAAASTPKIIFDPRPHDILSGRGASVNAHSGNRHFRTLCWSRKPDFDAGNHVTKRLIATEIVNSVKQHLNPPGRFLKKVDVVDENSGEKRTAYVEMTMDKSINKACQVMRDVNRPDRINWVAESNAGNGGDQVSPAAKRSSKSESSNTPTEKKRRKSRATPVAVGEAALSSKDNLLLNSSSAAEGFVMTATVSSSSSHPTISPGLAMKKSLFKTYTIAEQEGGGLVPHDHDVLSGRGAYVNAHAGNRRLRSLALERKDKFDKGNYNDKRSLAAEIVRIIQSLDPPGRFLKKKDAPATLEGGCTVSPWCELEDDRAVHKACQVMRDLRRPDRMPAATSAVSSNDAAATAAGEAPKNANTDTPTPAGCAASSEAASPSLDCTENVADAAIDSTDPHLDIATMGEEVDTSPASAAESADGVKDAAGGGVGEEGSDVQETSDDVDRAVESSEVGIASEVVAL